jgi:hypothetical protein
MSDVATQTDWKQDSSYGWSPFRLAHDAPFSEFSVELWLGI